MSQIRGFLQKIPKIAKKRHICNASYLNSRLELRRKTGHALQDGACVTKRGNYYKTGSNRCDLLFDRALQQPGSTLIFSIGGKIEIKK